jgi:hypothetical protein
VGCYEACVCLRVGGKGQSFGPEPPNGGVSYLVLQFLASVLAGAVHSMSLLLCAYPY